MLPMTRPFINTLRHLTVLDLRVRTRPVPGMRSIMRSPFNQETARIEMQGADVRCQVFINRIVRVTIVRSSGSMSEEISVL